MESVCIHPITICMWSYLNVERCHHFFESILPIETGVDQIASFRFLLRKPSVLTLPHNPH